MADDTSTRRFGLTGRQARDGGGLDFHLEQLSQLLSGAGDLFFIKSGVFHRNGALARSTPEEHRFPAIVPNNVYELQCPAPPEKKG